jgi:tetratricopeptide (TPR) repeat protein
MPASITRLKPRFGSFERGLSSFRAARLTACLGELHGLTSVSAVVLAARAHLRLGKPQAALEAMREIRASDARDRGEVALLRAVASGRLGETAASEAAFLEARGYGFSSTDPVLQAEVEFYLGLAAFGDGAFDDARAACRRSLDAAAMPVPAGDVSTAGAVPLAHVVARTQELLGVIAAAEGDYGEFLVQARSVLDTLDACEARDVYQEAFALKNLSILVRDFDLPADAEGVSARVLSLPWTLEIARPKFVTTEALGWCAALHGDPVGASRWFRESAAVATSLPERIQASVNKAILAHQLGCEPLAFEELDHALGLAETCDWENADDDFRVVLLSLAQAAAHSAPLRAREALERYRKIRNAMDPRFAARVEVRVVAEEAYTQGVVLRAERRAEASIERLTFAFSAWESIGYDWRAGRAALELAELGAGEVFRLAVRRELKRRPDSLFASRARLIA